MKTIIVLLSIFLSSNSFAGLLDFFKSESELWLSECELVEQSKERQFYVYQQVCQDSAKEFLSQGFQITNQFSVPDALARRVNFWKMIYSYFSINDYVIHSKDYPELIFEIVHQVNPEKRNIDKPKSAIKNRVALLRKNLLAMERINSGIFQDPEHQRLANLMSHIADEGKFKKAANSLRTQRGQREFVRKGIENSKKYLPQIEKDFILEGVPSDLATIAFVESSFNTKAHSKVGASGVYQLMPFVAKKYMIVNDLVDERVDPIKSGRVAAKLFKANYKMLGNWPLAITAYNHGPFGIKRAVRHAGSTDLPTIIAKYSGKGFGFASQNFYAEFLAMLDTVVHSKKYFGVFENIDPLSFQEIRLPYTYSLKTLLSKYEITRDTLLEHNPELFRVVRSNGNLINKGFLIKLPKSR